MKITKAHMQVYAVTDSRWSVQSERKFLSDIEAALRGGITCLQLREKMRSDDAFIALAFKVKRLCKMYNVPFIINDNVTVTKAVDADGIHVGQSDLSVPEIRKLLGDKIIGVSVHSVDEALKASADGANYLGVGAMFGTATKKDTHLVTNETLSEICQSSLIPVVAIGGINADNIAKLSTTGVNGVAVVSAIFAQKDIFSATERLVKLSQMNYSVDEKS